MYFDGSMRVMGTGAGIIVISRKGDKMKYVLQIHFLASNNVIEYEALMHGLYITINLRVRRLICGRDSDLVV
jgi:ribonuclease HI